MSANQIEMFSDSDSFSQGLSQLYTLNFPKALSLFKQAGEKTGIDNYIEITQIWQKILPQKDIKQIDAEALAQKWQEFESRLHKKRSLIPFTGEFKQKYFEIIIDRYLPFMTFFTGKYHIGYYMMAAGFPGKAVKNLREEIKNTGEQPVYNGYLGDCFIIMKYNNAAKMHYEKAYFSNPLEVNVRETVNEEILAIYDNYIFKSDQLAAEMIPVEMWLNGKWDIPESEGEDQIKKLQNDIKNIEKTPVVEFHKNEALKIRLWRYYLQLSKLPDVEKSIQEKEVKAIRKKMQTLLPRHFEKLLQREKNRIEN